MSSYGCSFLSPGLLLSPSSTVSFHPLAMDHPIDADDARLAALCSCMGRLWSEESIEICDEEVPPEKIEECQLTLVGKLLNNPTVNFPAFQTTMKKAWRTDLVDFSQGDTGLFIIKFQSSDVKQRVIDNGPWLFGNHLLILKPWIANTPLSCYDFSTCAFWVQIVGLPLERCTENIIRRAASTSADNRDSPQSCREKFLVGLQI